MSLLDVTVSVSCEAIGSLRTIHLVVLGVWLLAVSHWQHLHLNLLDQLRLEPALLFPYIFLNTGDLPLGCTAPPPTKVTQGNTNNLLTVLQYFKFVCLQTFVSGFSHFKRLGHAVYARCVIEGAL